MILKYAAKNPGPKTTVENIKYWKNNLFDYQESTAAATSTKKKVLEIADQKKSLL